jgi:hypothetical protein
MKNRDHKLKPESELKCERAWAFYKQGALVCHACELAGTTYYTFRQWLKLNGKNVKVKKRGPKE